MKFVNQNCTIYKLLFFLKKSDKYTLDKRFEKAFQAHQSKY